MDFSYTTDPELLKLAQQVSAEPEEFNHWEKLVRAVENQEGGLNRNSSPQAIAATRATYDRLLARFPLFFAYWKKYADMEFSIGGTEAAEMVYERGVASIPASDDLWTHYCGFKDETCHDVDVMRELFERAADSVGLAFLSHPFWDKYIEFEERQSGDTRGRIFAILGRIIHIPLHQYARYFERYRTMAAQRSIDELAPKDLIEQFRTEVSRDGKSQTPEDVERDLRARIDTFHLETFQRTQTEVTQRWTYESEIKRPFYHVEPLSDHEVDNWRKYLDFEEAAGDYARTKFLYERCLVTLANYEEFWYRYARWTLAQTSRPEQVRNEEVRIIYSHAACTYVYISHPEIRLSYARFEESLGRADTAIAIHEAILQEIPSHLETIISLISTHRRQSGVDSALGVLQTYIDNGAYNPIIRGTLVAEKARLVWKVKGEMDNARKLFQTHQGDFADCGKFWMDWLEFEKGQPASQDDEPMHYQRIKSVYDTVRRKSILPTPVIKELASTYLSYLVERGGHDSMVEWTQVDKDINGPPSVTKFSSDAKDFSHARLENGSAGATAAPYQQYYQETAARV